MEKFLDNMYYTWSLINETKDPAVFHHICVLKHLVMAGSSRFASRLYSNDVPTDVFEKIDQKYVLLKPEGKPKRDISPIQNLQEDSFEALGTVWKILPGSEQKYPLKMILFSSKREHELFSLSPLEWKKIRDLKSKVQPVEVEYKNKKQKEIKVKERQLELYFEEGCLVGEVRLKEGSVEKVILSREVEETISEKMPSTFKINLDGYNINTCPIGFGVPTNSHPTVCLILPNGRVHLPYQKVEE